MKRIVLFGIIGGVAVACAIAIPLTIHFVKKANYEKFQNSFNESYRLYSDDIADGVIDDKDAYKHITLTSFSIEPNGSYEKGGLIMCDDVDGEVDFYRFNNYSWEFYRKIDNRDIASQAVIAVYIDTSEPNGNSPVQIVHLPEYTYLTYNNHRLYSMN